MSMLEKLSTFLGYIFFFIVILLALALVGTMMPFAQYGMRIVESGSMLPTIPTGAVILISPAESYTVGDIVTFQRTTDTEVTTHRIIEERIVAGEEEFVTKGDANSVKDLEPVTHREVFGKVRAHIPYLGYVLSFFRQPIGFLLLVVVPGVLVIVEQMRKIKAEVRHQRRVEQEDSAKKV